MSYNLIFCCLVLFMVSGCSNQSNDKDPAYMLVTHYYSIKYENDIAQKDTVKDCFSCNQAEVYNADDTLLELRFYKANMSDMFGYEVYRYNKDGHRIGSIYFDGDSATTRYDYELDTENNISQGLAFSLETEELLYGYKNAYDSLGNHISTGSMNAKKEIIDYYVREFNENGIAIKENIVDLEGNPTFRVRYEYRPSADSNWTEQLTYYNDTLSEIRFRERIELE